MKTIAIGADDAAYAFRDTIVAYLNGLGINVADYSSDKRQGSTVYPDVAHAVAMSIKQGEHERGILISAERARKSNNAQIITLGARVIGTELGKKIIQAWLESEYEGGGSAPKVERIDYYEHQHARD